MLITSLFDYAPHLKDSNYHTSNYYLGFPIEKLEEFISVLDCSQII